MVNEPNHQPIGNHSHFSKVMGEMKNPPFTACLLTFESFVKKLALQDAFAPLQADLSHE